MPNPIPKSSENQLLKFADVPWIPDSSLWIPDSAPWIPDSTTWIPDSRKLAQDKDSGFLRCLDSGFHCQDSGFQSY